MTLLMWLPPWLPPRKVTCAMPALLTRRLWWFVLRSTSIDAEAGATDASTAAAVAQVSSRKRITRTSLSVPLGERPHGAAFKFHIGKGSIALERFCKNRTTSGWNGMNVLQISGYTGQGPGMP